MTSWKASSERRRELIFKRATMRVGMSQRDIGGGFATVDRDIAHVDLKAKGSGMDAADFGAATGDAFDFGDQTAANQRLERFRVDVDKQAESSKECRAVTTSRYFHQRRGGLGRALVSLRLNSRVIG